MAQPFQKRHANEIVGIFVLLTFGIIVAAIAFGPHTRRWLTPARKLAVRLPPEGSLGLRKGADVLILGSVVGSVDDITVSDAGEMEAEVVIRGNFIRFVRDDSRAIIRKPFGIGDASIEITRGKGSPLPPAGAAISSYSDKAPTQMLEETLADIRSEAVPALREIRTAVSEYTRLATDLRGQRPGLTSAIGHFNRVAADVEAGKGIVGVLTSDPAAADSLRKTLPKVDAIMEDTRFAVADLRKVAARLPDLEQSTRQTLDKAPGLVLQVGETFRQLQRLAEAMQHNWLLSGGADRSAPGPRMGADRVGTDR